MPYVVSEIVRVDCVVDEPVEGVVASCHGCVVGVTTESSETKKAGAHGAQKAGVE